MTDSPVKEHQDILDEFLQKLQERKDYISDIHYTDVCDLAQTVKEHQSLIPDLERIVNHAKTTEQKRTLSLSEAVECLSPEAFGKLIRLARLCTQNVYERNGESNTGWERYNGVTHELNIEILKEQQYR